MYTTRLWKISSFERLVVRPQFDAAEADDALDWLSSSGFVVSVEAGTSSALPPATWSSVDIVEGVAALDSLAEIYLLGGRSCGVRSASEYYSTPLPTNDGSGQGCFD